MNDKELRAEVVRFVRGLRAPRQSPVSRRQIEKHLKGEATAKEISNALDYLLTEGKIDIRRNGPRTGHSWRQGYSYKVANPARLTVPNPTLPGALRPAVEITDRAKRYRAQKEAGNGERCGYCGAPRSSRRRLDVDHIDGNEAHGNPENLLHACRPCNTKKGATFAKAGIGVRTRQYNPKGPTGGRIVPSKGAQNYKDWAMATMIVKGERPGNIRAAASKIAHTSQAKREQYARDIWDKRKELYGPSGSTLFDVPF